jgi:hypothetical protein|tara:strand:- start:2139 stop:2285 length:147 start_codon:yes stop_codon:yes gene_type:complete
MPLIFLKKFIDWSDPRNAAESEKKIKKRMDRIRKQQETEEKRKQKKVD